MGRTHKMPSANRKHRGKKREKNEDEEAVQKEPNGSFAWKDLLPSQVRTLIQTETPEELQEKMSVIMNFEQHEEDLKEATQLDCFVIAFHWAKEHGFDERQLSGFITLVSNLLKNIKDTHMTKSENLNYLKECFSGVGSESPAVVPIPLYFFKLDHAKLIMEYLISTLFHHYSLYEYLYLQEQDELIVGTDLCVEVCSEMNGPFPPPLEEAMPQEIFENFHPSQAKEEKADDENADAMTDDLTEAVLKEIETSDSKAVKTVPTTELRRIIEKITKEMIIPAKTELRNKIKDKESSYLARIEKVQAK